VYVRVCVWGGGGGTCQCQFLTGGDVVPVHRDVRVSVGAVLFMPESQGVDELVHGGALLLTAVTQRDEALAVVVTNRRVAAETRAETWTRRHGHGDTETRRHGNGHGHGDMDTETWTRRHGHGAMDTEP
jgi:hypothetical protein